jgi:protein-S-isoprenylcysteine O-methyltransferase Ste14
MLNSTLQTHTAPANACAVSQSPKKMNLGARVALRLLLIPGAIVAILFIPAGTWSFWQAWAFLGSITVPAMGIFAYFWKRDPQVVERRMQSKEPVREQQLLMRLAKPLFVVLLTIPGFDHRWGWSRALLGAVPPWLSLLSLAMVFAGYLGIFWVINVNRFAARTIRVEPGQKVISTGPYRFIRHPMYSASIVLWLFIPLALGSWVALPAFVLLLPFYPIRLLNEEKVLREQLPGYSEYCLRTRYRLIPFVW